MQIYANEYERMRAWLGHVSRQVFPNELITSESDPLVVLDRLAASSPGKALKGLSMAVGDLIEMTSNMPEEQVVALDQALRSGGLPSLTEMRVRFSKAVQRAVRRGYIRDDAELYAVRNAMELAGPNDGALTALFAAYEASHLR